AYVQLPEDYADRLVDVALQAEFASLEITQKWSDHLVRHNNEDPAKFTEVANRLKKRIENLRRFQDQHEKWMSAATRNENLGLLGSAEKRLAELYFHGAAFSGDAPGWMSESRAALGRAKDWYQEGFTGNLSHHWTGVQSLALEAVLTGKIERI